VAAVKDWALNSFGVSGGLFEAFERAVDDAVDAERARCIQIANELGDHMWNILVNENGNEIPIAFRQALQVGAHAVAEAIKKEMDT
jgi:hypothetical protein